jgi:acyl-coenzyme A synthetase/AMP-(fatty) acid ligase
MKKVLSILMVFGLLFTSQTKAFNVSQTLDSVKSIATSIKDSAVQSVKEVDTSSTFKSMYSDFKQGIVALASSLKVGAEHVYGVLVRQQVVYAIVYLALSIIGFILILLQMQITWRGITMELVVLTSINWLMQVGQCKVLGVMQLQETKTINKNLRLG